MKNLMLFDTNVRNAFNNDNDEFVCFNELLLDCANHSVKEYSEKVANKKIVDKFRAAIGVSEDDKPAQVRRAIKANKELVYTLIEETIDEMLITGWMENPFFIQYVDLKNLALDDENDFYVADDSILSVSKVSGNHHNMIRQRLGAGKTFSVETSWIALKVYAEFERLMTGVEEFSTLVSKITEAIDRYVNEALYQALMGVGSTLGAQWYKSSAISSTTADTLRTLCMDVGIASNSEVVIMGTRAALASVYALNNVDWASSEMKNEKYLTGKFGLIDILH